MTTMMATVMIKTCKIDGDSWINNGIWSVCNEKLGWSEGGSAKAIDQRKMDRAKVGQMQWRQGRIGRITLGDNGNGGPCRMYC